LIAYRRKILEFHIHFGGVHIEHGLAGFLKVLRDNDIRIVYGAAFGVRENAPLVIRAGHQGRRYGSVRQGAEGRLMFLLDYMELGNNLQITRPAILVVSFGTSYNETREKTIGAIEAAIASAYPGREVRRAFTSRAVIDSIAWRDGERIDTVTEAVERLAAAGVRELTVQPTQFIGGFEYEGALAAVKPYAKHFDSVKYGKPLLDSAEDYRELTAALGAEAKGFGDGGTAMVFMGHGTGHPANAAYARLNDELRATGLSRFVAGAVKAEPGLDEVIAAVKALGLKRVLLSPLMIAAGDHANNDMAGGGRDSWKSVLEAEGFEVAVNLRGLGELPAIQAMFVRHMGEARTGEVG
jgi:sirohydrochlorin cobaltochelatase